MPAPMTSMQATALLIQGLLAVLAFLRHLSKIRIEGSPVAEASHKA
jgi:hypothetical protein